MKNHNKKQKENSTSVSSWNMLFCCCLFLLSEKRSFFYWISKFNILRGATNTERATRYAQHGFCCVRIAHRITMSVLSESLFPRKISRPVALFVALPRTHTVTGFSVNRKTHITLTYPMQVCFPPRRFIQFSESRWWKNVCLQPDIGHIITRLKHFFPTPVFPPRRRRWRTKKKLGNLWFRIRRRRRKNDCLLLVPGTRSKLLRNWKTVFRGVKSGVGSRSRHFNLVFEEIIAPPLIALKFNFKLDSNMQSRIARHISIH